ncbi:hypothetical protein H8356DRAFT_1717079, partial [Neocallimastix lanati (nom. inval.)]
IIIYINLKYCKNYNKIHINIYAISFILLYNLFVTKSSFYINFISISYFILSYYILLFHCLFIYFILFYFD